MTNPEGAAPLRAWLIRLLKLRVWIFDHVRPTELQITLFWAGVIGFVGAVASVAFRWLTVAVHWSFTGSVRGAVETFSHLTPAQRLLVPIAGGAMAGLAIHFGARLSPTKSSTDYMEAVVVGDGKLPARLSFVKCLSALFSISSGASIGREGPLVQLSAVLASLIGRVRRTPPAQLRLLVACGASAGIAAAYNAPIGGALFVAEIILQSVAMESFGPLVFASVIATLTSQHFLGSEPLYEVKIASVRLQSNLEIPLYLLLGIVAGLIAPLFLRLLRWSESAFEKLNAPAYVKLALGGLIVGALAVLYPEVCGNGYSVVNQILRGEWVMRTLLVILLFKFVATAATFGSGAVGGVFTPTLFGGACIGFIFSSVVQHFWPGPPLVSNAFALVGMGAFLAATTHAPIMAIIMLFELTLDYHMILPLMLACVVAHYTCMAFETKSIYAEALQRKGSGIFQAHLQALRVADLMKPNPALVKEEARFGEIAQHFITNRFNYLYVVGPNGAFKGVVSLHDIKSHLGDPAVAALVIARDLIREQFPAITPDESLAEALKRFSRFDGERLPVVRSEKDGQLLGSISKRDLILALAEQNQQ